MRLEQDPIHRHKDVLAHTIAVVAKTRPELKVRLAALLHDVGKPRTRGFNDNGVTFHHHEVVGARMAKERLLALRYPNEIVEDVTAARVPAPAVPHLPHGLDRQRGAPLRARRRPSPRRAQRADPLRLHDAQRTQGAGARPAHGRARRRASRSCRSRRSSTKIKPPLDGNEVMQFLGVAPARSSARRVVPPRAASRRRPDRGGRGLRALRAWARERGIEPASSSPGVARRWPARTGPAP